MSDISKTKAELIDEIKRLKAENDHLLTQLNMQERAVGTGADEVLAQVILSQIVDTVLVTDMQGNFRYICPNIHYIFGYSVNETEAMHNISALLQRDLLAEFDLQDRNLVENIAHCVTDKYGNEHNLYVTIKSVQLQIGSYLFTCHDITQQRRMEQQLHFDQQLLNSVRESIVATDMDYRIIYWSPGAEQLYGYSADEAIGETIFLIVDSEEQEAEEDRIAAVIKHGTWRGQYYQRRKDGSRFWADTAISLIKNEKGEPCGLIGIDRDHTAFKEAVNRITRHTDLLNQMGRMARIGGWEYDPDTGLVTCTEIARELFGVEEVMPLLDATSYFPQPHRQLIVRAVEKAFETGDEFDFQMPFQTKSGDLLWVHLIGKPVTRDHQIVRLNGTLQDVTTQKTMDDALQESENRYRSLVNHAPFGILVLDKRGNIIETNPAMVDMLGAPAESELLKINVYAFQHTVNTGITADFQKCYEEKRGFTRERWFTSYWQKTVYIRYHVLPLLDKQSQFKGILAVIEDVTSQKNALDALNQRDEQLHLALMASESYLWELDLTENRLTYLFTGENSSSDIQTDQSEVTFEEILQHIHPDDREKVKQRLDDHLNDKAALYDVQYRYQTVMGEWAWFGSKGQINAWDADGAATRMMGITFNMTERKQKEQLLHSVLDNSPTGIMLLKQIKNNNQELIDFEWMLCNQTAGQILEVEPELLLGKRLLKVMPSMGTDGLFDSLAGVVKNGTVLDTEHEYIQNDLKKWFRLVATRLENNLVMTFNDITVGKMAEQELRSSEEKYRTIIQTANDAIFIADGSSGKIIEANQRAAELLRKPHDQLIGMHHTELHPPEKLADYSQIFQKQVKNGGEYIGEMLVRRADGEDIPVDVSSVIIEIRGKKYNFGIFHDLTQRKKSEAELNRVNQRLMWFVEENPLAFTEIDTNFVIQRWNRAAELLFGYSEDEAVGHNILELIVPDEVHANIKSVGEELRSGTGGYHSLNENITKDGRRIICDWHNTPLLDDDGNVNGWASLAQDVTERVEMQDAMRKARDAAEAANQAKSDFLAHMSHELRTPLNGILGYAQILRKDANLSDEQRAKIQVMESSGRHLLNLINDILDLSKIEANKLELNPSTVDLNVFLSSICNMIEIRAVEKSLRFNFKRDERLPTAVRVDEKLLRQVLLNLLSNAVKFTDEGSVDFTCMCLLSEETISLEDANKCQIRFEIVDTGIGISSQDVEKIFSPFAQIAHHTRPVEGTGLGLTICRQLIKMMGSTLHVESTVDQGSRFWFSLEVAIVKHPADTVSGKEREIQGYEGARKRLLVVDDKEENRQFLVDALTPLGFEVEQADSGSAALDRLESCKPNLVLMDLVMPGLDGRETIRQMRERPGFENIRVIYISAQTTPLKDLSSGISEEADFIAKPVQLSELLEKIKSQLGIEWVLSPTAAQVVAAGKQALPEAPDIDTLQHLLLAANRGDIVLLRQLIKELQPLYGVFAKRLEMLVSAFQIKEIERYLQKFLP